MKRGSEIKDGIEIMVDQSEDQTSVAVRCVEADRGYTHAAVRLFYRVNVPVFRSLLVSRVDVIPLVQGAFSMASFSAVPLEDAEFVRVELMQSYGRLDFFRDKT